MWCVMIVSLLMAVDDDGVMSLSSSSSSSSSSLSHQVLQDGAPLEVEDVFVQQAHDDSRGNGSGERFHVFT